MRGAGHSPVGRCYVRVLDRVHALSKVQTAVGVGLDSPTPLPSVCPLSLGSADKCDVFMSSLKWALSFACHGAGPGLAEIPKNLGICPMETSESYHTLRRASKLPRKYPRSSMGSPLLRKTQRKKPKTKGEDE